MSRNEEQNKRSSRNGIRKRKDCGGRYELSWQGEVVPETGKRQRHTKLLPKNTGYRQAQQIRAECIARTRGETNIPLNDVTLEHFAKSYLEEHENQKDIACKRQRINSRILPELGKRPLADISVQEFKHFKKALVGKVGGTKREKREKTANRYLTVLKHMIWWGVDQDLVQEDVLKRVRKVAQYPEGEGRILWFYASQVNSLLEAFCNPELRCMWLVIRLRHGRWPGVRICPT